MAKPTLKDLRTTYRVLSHLESNLVPQGLLIELAEQIKHLEKRKLTNRIARMSEEDLIRFQAISHHRLRIDLPDGRIVQEKTNEATFYMALREADLEKVSRLGLTVRGNALLVTLPKERIQLNGHKRLEPGYFVVRGVKPEERRALLERIDKSLQLEWTIRLV